MTADQDILDITAEIRHIIADAQADWTQADQGRRIPALITRNRVGSISNYADTLVGMLVQPPQPLPPAPLRGFAVSYGGHDPARDVYLGFTPEQREWGTHWGIDLRAPAPGRVEAYQSPTPLSAFKTGTPEYLENHARLFAAGPPCCPPPRRVEGRRVPLTAQPGARIATSWDSGIRFENQGIPARASHVHLCASATGTLSPNGDTDGLLAAAALGWQVEWHGNGGPGPDQYLSGQWIAGKPKAAWQGRPLPPAPS
jgi:hypothetical protein